VSANATVSVGSNTPPTAQFTHSPTAPKVGEVVNFSAAESVDPDGEIKKYEWDFGDGATASGIRTSHVYQTANSFSAVLVVTDDLGATGSKSSNVRVSLGDAPIASFTFSPSSPTLGTGGTVTVTFDASSSRDPDGRIVEYTWEWGDGTSPVIKGEGEPKADHTFTASDSFTVKLTVRDDLNNTSSSTQTVTVN
jgi:PKD repeat protein